MFSLRHKAEKSHKQRLPPRGSCRGATEGECATCVFLPYSVLKLLLLPLLSLRQKAEFCINPWLPCAKGAPAERVRDCLESTKSVKIHSRLCGTNPLSAEPQHPSVSRSADSSPLKKRAAFAGTNCGAKKKTLLTFSLAGSFRHARA